MFSRQPKPISEHLAKHFAPEKMGTGMKRGLVLKIYKAKVAEVCGETVAKQIKAAKLKGTDDNPDLFIYCDNHTALHIMNMNRRDILKLINQRMKTNFVKSVWVR